MAQGRQERLAELGHPKQLLEIAPGETILARTIRLLKEIIFPEPEDEIDVVGSTELASSTHGASLIPLDDPGFCILDGLARKRLIADRTVVLLGDVVYSRRAISTILGIEQDLFFFGTPDLTNSTGEIFAFGFSLERLGDVRRALDEAPCRRAQVDKGQPGHLRYLMRDLGIVVGGPGYIESTDWTKDIDTPKDLREVLPHLREMVALEE